MIMGTISSEKTIYSNIEKSNNRDDYTHTVFLEIGTSQNCNPCHYWSEKIYDTYTSGDYDFQYVEMIVYDHNGERLNDEAFEWEKIYGIGAYPTSIIDGNYEKIVGNNQGELPDKLNSCGTRAVSDISADMFVLWMENATLRVDITIENNENAQYNGHIRACITEIVSRYDTDEGEPYHYGFLSYAFNKDISIDALGIYSDSVIWDGNEHFDNHGDDFGDIDKDNIQVTMGVLNDQNGYVDETISAFVTENFPPEEPNSPDPANGETNVDKNHDLSWDCSDPNGGLIKYDVYFGTNNPPPKVASNITGKSYDPGEMVFKTTYFWKIVAWDNLGASTSGPIWNFSIKDKSKDIQSSKLYLLKMKPFSEVEFLIILRDILLIRGHLYNFLLN
jgi:hypothetical protein